MAAHPLETGARIIGEVGDRADDQSPALVVMTSTIGARRIVDMLSGEQLPRIC
jgi:hydrogenase expression/formation protein HypE